MSYRRHTRPAVAPATGARRAATCTRQLRVFVWQAKAGRLLRGTNRGDSYQGAPLDNRVAHSDVRKRRGPRTARFASQYQANITGKMETTDAPLCRSRPRKPPAETRHDIIVTDELIVTGELIGTGHYYRIRMTRPQGDPTITVVCLRNSRSRWRSNS
jgi:hypothetical protein